ncbi:hypothetical protein TSAR_016915 [Trichomalopsis sarcophagae]|uniref:Uncharacterized protein n=1 Tax=Trichomalopsis sarcophagae TaxID=543379 RepID=A0A232F560_9HYME|nr:hypothetical protein TSAR_016915 [Trichomalopsis sarcophagae]
MKYYDKEIFPLALKEMQLSDTNSKAEQMRCGKGVFEDRRRSNAKSQKEISDDRLPRNDI